MTLEYAGPYLALIEITHFYEVAILFFILAAFWAPLPLLVVALAAACFVGEIVLDNACARLTTSWMAARSGRCR